MSGFHPDGGSLCCGKDPKCGALKAASSRKSSLTVLPMRSKESFSSSLLHFVALLMDLSHYKVI